MSLETLHKNGFAENKLSGFTGNHAKDKMTPCYINVYLSSQWLDGDEAEEEDVGEEGDEDEVDHEDDQQIV